MAVWNSHVMGYFTEVFLHSLITALVVEALIYSWRLDRPTARVRFRCLVLVLPLLLPLLYRLVYPSRGNELFRENAAIFVGAPWLQLEFLGSITVAHVATIIMGATALIFLLREVAPLASSVADDRNGRRKKASPGEYPSLEAALHSLADKLKMNSNKKPDIYILEAERPILRATRLRRPALLISNSLLELLDAEELKCALAHELAHIINHDRLKGLLLLLFRAAMFYNPVALVAFQGIINETDKARDDAAVDAAGDPFAYASSLVKIYEANVSRRDKEAPRQAVRWLRFMASGEESSSYKKHIEERIKRLMRGGGANPVQYEEFRLGLVAGSLAVLLFFVVY